MPEIKNLFDPLVLSSKKDAQRTSHGLYQEAARRLHERLEDVTQPFTAACDWAAARDDDSNLHFNLITSCLALQSVNNLGEELSRIRAALNDGGLFLAVMMGGQTLHELRSCLMGAEIELSGGASPRVAPMYDLETLSRTLTSAGFALPVVDHDRVQLAYPDLYALMHDLRAYGCANALAQRSRRFTSRLLFEKADALYKTRFPAASGGIIATIDLVFLHGWRE